VVVVLLRVSHFLIRRFVRFVVVVVGGAMSVIVTVPVPLCKSVMSASKLTNEKWEREREREREVSCMKCFGWVTEK
jgi:hypothetical protein